MLLPENTMLVGSYDYRLVALSVVIATFASYAALRPRGSGNHRPRIGSIWLVGGWSQCDGLGHLVHALHWNVSF